MPFDVKAVVRNLKDKPAPLCYKDWERVYFDIITHTRGKKPVKLDARRPAEPPEVKDYRCANFRSVTKGSINKGIDNLFSLFQSSSWTFVASNQLMKYLQDARFKKLNFKSYMERYAIRFGLEDSNGVIIWFPTFDEETGALTGVAPRLFNARKIRDIGEDYIIVADGKTIKYQADGKPVQSEMYWIVSDTGIWKYYKEKTNDGENWFTEPFYEFDFQLLPVVTFGGELVSNDEDTAHYFESFFQCFVPFADEALNDFSDNQAIKITAAFPAREEISLDCDYPGCQGGVILKPTIENPDNSDACPKCKGEGSVVNRSPYGVYKRKPKSDMNPDGLAPNDPMLRFTSPDAAIIESGNKNWKEMLHMAEDALHLVYIDEAQSGVAKEIDREGKKSMLTKFGNNWFDNVLFNSLWIIENYIGVGTRIQPVVNKPVSYEIKTESDIIAEMKDLSAANVPKYIVSATLNELVRKRFNEGDPIQKIVTVLTRFDPFANYTQSEKERMFALGSMNQTQLTNSIYAFPLLQQVAEDRGNEFMSMSYDKVVVELLKLLAPYYAQQPAPPAPPTLP